MSAKKPESAVMAEVLKTQERLHTDPWFKLNFELVRDKARPLAEMADQYANAHNVFDSYILSVPLLLMI